MRYMRLWVLSLITGCGSAQGWACITDDSSCATSPEDSCTGDFYEELTCRDFVSCQDADGNAFLILKEDGCEEG